MTAWVASGVAAAREKAPLGASLTTTRFGTVWEPVKFTSLTVRRVAASAGERVREPPVVGAAGDHRGGGAGGAGRGDAAAPGHLVGPRLVDHRPERGAPRVLEAERREP